MQTAIAIAQQPRPFFKWAGGKFDVFEQYKTFLPTAYCRYWEPFLGGGGMFFRLRPDLAVLSDVNPALVNAYLEVRDNVEGVVAGLREMEEKHCRDFYYETRDKFPANASPYKQAIRFLYLNKTCFNGLYRENSRGYFNVPMGSYRKPRICDPDLLLAASIALQGVEIKCQGYEAIADHVQAGDLVIFDPPYDKPTKTAFSRYSRFDFSQADQEKLANVFKQVVSAGAHAFVCNSDTEFIRDLYSDFRIESILEPRFINSKGGGRGKVPCVLVVGGQNA